MKLSVLDQAPVTKGNHPPDAVTKAEELALLTDQLGYDRMWMAEHHGTHAFASSAPEITAAHLAAKTEQIRIGTGGVMMMHYSPLKLAEVFKTLSALAPGRIDFGVGRAPGGDNFSVYALSEGRQPMVHNMYEKFSQALTMINDEKPADDLYSKTPAMPAAVQLPQAWLLGSSGNSAQRAARMGVGYSFAQFFNGEMTPDILAAYRNNFEPSVFMEKPYINVSYMVTTAETADEAEFESGPQDIARLKLMRGEISPVITPEEAAEYPLTEMDRMRIEENRKLHLVGSAKDVAEQLRYEQDYYGYDEAMICSIPHSQEKRLNVYRLLARELLD
ncbi:LLM class flavin-dependent oxidoreductase [Salisediminibacterium halotolerans]|uniref:LLM class flavin-dependent oxidoreductase n=1 Tax=Salisediminibacterium halotolerans TaxID=517425 RepID=UPI000EAC5483|nr:LLM class flavin-dependent oxidoreductase [Salisediminibacterium halotolerans]RLJ73147.1 luciferase family oxidoreductase group 1 [Actinophytocola xinjiangensis]RPE86569.1 luciferase family oxidoreductase group 1 [Salisediminibacterium halotolerans]TWG33944.1 luciferase family oxidoreductase group 1 [Salisediminibacterium halotolerans]GEL06649.1 luciferase [Salisediminibacterium halotolerans]